MSKRTWSNQYKDLPNQSNFHEELKEIFRSDPLFKGMRCYQEVPVEELCPAYDQKGHRFDYYIDEMGVVIELHGKQHYTRTTFGKMSYHDSVEQFKGIQQRDSSKKQAAEDAGLLYVTVPYTMQKKLTAEYIKSLIYGRLDEDSD